VPRIESFDEVADFSGVAEAHPVAMERIRDAGGIGRITEGEGDDLIGAELVGSLLGVLIEGTIASGRGGPVHFDWYVDEVRMDIVGEDFSDDPDLMTHFAELPTKVCCVAFRSPPLVKEHSLRIMAIFMTDGFPETKPRIF